MATTPMIGPQGPSHADAMEQASALLEEARALAEGQPELQGLLDQILALLSPEAPRTAAEELAYEGVSM